MTKSIFKSIFSISLGVLLAGLVLVIGVLHAYMEQQLSTELAVQGQYISQGLRLNGGDFLLGMTHESRVTWVDDQGQVLFDSESDPDAMENHALRPEIVEAMADGQGESIRYSDTLSQMTIYYALRLDDGSVLRVSDSQSSVWVLMMKALQPLLLVVLLAGLVTFVLAKKVAKKLVRPINEMDLNNPDLKQAYEEIYPLLRKLRSQQRQIRHQMQQLRRRQEEFAAITERMREGLLIIDDQGMVLSCNRSAVELLQAKLHKENAIHVLEFNRAPTFRYCVEQALSGQDCQERLETENSCLELIVSPVQQERNIGGVVMIIRDITEQEQRERLRREFTANVSHELKTPLTAILGTAEILKNGLVRPEDMGHFAGNIHRESERLIRLVNDIIKISRLDEGGLDTHWETMDLYKVAMDVASRLESAAAQKKVGFIVEGSCAMVHGLSAVVDEVVYNLCDNAIVYNKEGGQVTVTIQDTPIGAVIQVRDTGPGIPAEAQKRIFERFYRLDSSRSSPGTGLGLSIVKHGAAYLKAILSLDSQVGKGSCFSVSFPKVEGEE